MGGTFESLHAGHSQLIEEAFDILAKNGGGFVHIGLTSDEMASSKNHSVSKYSVRENELNHYIFSILKKHSLPPDSYAISKIEDPFGSTISDYYDIIVVSPDTRAGAEKINEIRRTKGLALLKIHVVDFVLAEDTIPISTTRIYNGEIDKNGQLQKKFKN